MFCFYVLFICILVFMTIGKTYAQTVAGVIAKLIEKDGGHALLVDGEPFLIHGGQARNSNAWPGILPNYRQRIFAFSRFLWSGKTNWNLKEVND